jgi:hypothetical protein
MSCEWASAVDNLMRQWNGNANLICENGLFKPWLLYELEEYIAAEAVMQTSRHDQVLWLVRVNEWSAYGVETCFDDEKDT